MTNRIKVAVTLTVDVADEWALDYGRDVDVRRDVRDAAAYAVLYVNPAVKSVKIGGRAR